LPIDFESGSAKGNSGQDATTGFDSWNNAERVIFGLQRLLGERKIIEKRQQKQAE